MSSPPCRFLHDARRGRTTGVMASGKAPLQVAVIPLPVGPCACPGMPARRPHPSTLPRMADYPDPTAFVSLVDLLDDAAKRWPADRPLVALRTDAGLSERW